MSQCGCGSETSVFDGQSVSYRRVLWAVILINATMFVVEMVSGHVAGSQALQADALDFLGDTFTYGLTLAVIGQSWRARTNAALVKGASLGAIGLGVLIATVHRLFVLDLPAAAVMGGVGLLALAANVTSVMLLMRYRNGDANVRSVWLCSRNDAIGNVAVMLAAAAVWVSGSAWPDLLVALVIASLFLWSAAHIVRQALVERRRHHASLMVSR